jgi:rRNA maturation RNase YbeY
LKTIAPARARGTVSIALVSDARVRALNRRYRGVNRATDVLSYPATAAPRATSPQKRVTRNEPRVTTLGDIVIARGVARRQAREAGHSELTEWRVLALHGLLHLLGYDHELDGGYAARRAGLQERYFRPAASSNGRGARDPFGRLPARTPFISPIGRRSAP